MKRLVVMISGGGSNLQALIDACQTGTLDAEHRGRLLQSRRRLTGWNGPGRPAFLRSRFRWRPTGKLAGRAATTTRIWQSWWRRSNRI